MKAKPRPRETTRYVTKCGVCKAAVELVADGDKYHLKCSKCGHETTLTRTR